MHEKQENPARIDDARTVPWWFALILISLALWGLAYLALLFV